MKNIILLFYSTFTWVFCLGQVNSSQGITYRTIGNDMVQFSATLRPLCQKAGAPTAHFKFFWEFGDGTFSDASLDAKPVHRYKTSGQYKVHLFVTNVYDNCATPPILQVTTNVVVRSPAGITKRTTFFKGKENIGIKVNRFPKPSDTLLAYFGYRNSNSVNAAGSLILFYNDKRFLRKSFKVVDSRVYNDEEPFTDQPGYFRFHDKAYRMQQELQQDYIDHVVLRFNNLQNLEERFVFLTMQVLPYMKDKINGTITMAAMIVPDRLTEVPEKYILQVPIVTSYDPNKMTLKENPVDRRFIRKKRELTYKVEFENEGKGHADSILIAVALPRQFDTATLGPVKTSPITVRCDSVNNSQESCLITKISDSIRFFIKNVYLPGQRENLVRNDDSTKGFIEYTIRFKKHPGKNPFVSRASVTFDKNKPVFTNEVVGKFKKESFSGIMAGYSFSPSSGNFSAKGPLQIGFVLTPFGSNRLYYQAELHAMILQQQDSMGVTTKPSIPSDIRLDTNYRVDNARKETTLSMKRNLIQLVPLHIRYNINNWVGIGAGIMGQFVITEKTTSTERYSIQGTHKITKRTIDTLITRTSNVDTKKNSQKWSEANMASFFDIQVGKVKTGTALGFRYYRQWKGNLPNRFLLYAGWRF